jgi:flagellar biosynthesis chaperone FliJ
MLLRQTLLEEDEEKAKRDIAKLQRDRDSWAITNWEFEDKYETIMQNLRLRFAQVMDWRAWDSYKTYHKL